MRMLCVKIHRRCAIVVCHNAKSVALAMFVVFVKMYIGSKNFRQQGTILV